MKTKAIQNELKMDSFLGFSRLKFEEQAKLLREKGIKIDEDKEMDKLTRLYFINGFFVEETVTCPDNLTTEILPFRRGYKLDKYLEVKEVLAPKFAY
jgi:hypothetical protein